MSLLSMSNLTTVTMERWNMVVSIDNKAKESSHHTERHSACHNKWNPGSYAQKVNWVYDKRMAAMANTYFCCMLEQTFTHNTVVGTVVMVHWPNNQLVLYSSLIETFYGLPIVCTIFMRIEAIKKEMSSRWVCVTNLSPKVNLVSRHFASKEKAGNCHFVSCAVWS